MKIALIGYGKMGKAIEQIAVNRGHEIVLKINVANAADLTIENLQAADVAIEFTSPTKAVANYQICFDAGVPVVSGTTGWLEQQAEVVTACQAKKGCFFYASNFSLGVNLFFELNKHLAKLMNQFPEYNVEMTEVHHTQKLDAPSGTAISLAEDVFNELDRKSAWTLEEPTDASELHIQAVREGVVPGIHTLKYESDIDYIEITHSAKSRQGFALGAVLAAEFSKGKSGILSMKDLMKL